MGVVPMNTKDLLDLMLMYQGSIGTRVFSEGNQDYLELLIAAGQRLGRALAEAPLVPFLPRAKVVAIAELTERQRADNGQQVAREILGHLADLRERMSAVRRVPELYVKGALPSVAAAYDRIVVHFGPAMGLGDQITFFQLLRHVIRHCGKARVTVYTLYPGLWPHLLPGAEERSYRDDPVQPFFDMNEPADDKELIVTSDFEVFDLHRNIIAHRPGRDILEVSLGRMSAWLSSASSPWIHVEEFRAVGENNYAFVHALARRLVPGLSGSTAWEPLQADAPPPTSPLRSLAERFLPRRPAPPAAVRRRAGRGDGSRRHAVFVNPFTSKELPFTAPAWAWGIQEIHARTQGRVPFDVVIYPGIEPSTRAFAAEVCEQLREDVESDSIRARLLDADGQALTAVTALPAVARAVSGFDLCVTVDTFTAHLIPLFRVPTVVMAYGHYRRFWVPSRYTYNCLLEEMETRGVDLVARLLLLLSGEGPEISSLQEAASRLQRATREAHLTGVTARSAAAIEAALAHAFQQIQRDFPSYPEAQHWLMLWSRITWALGRRTVEPQSMRSYLDLWEQSDVFKLLTLA
jgi:hypothetical protein